MIHPGAQCSVPSRSFSFFVLTLPGAGSVFAAMGCTDSKNKGDKGEGGGKKGGGDLKNVQTPPPEEPYVLPFAAAPI
jgi:hypothetical protein